MVAVNAMTLGALTLSTQLLSGAVALSGESLQTYTEWKQSSYYSEAVKYVNTCGGSASGSTMTSVSKSGYSNSTSDAGETTTSSLSTNVTITSSSSSSSSVVVADISETEEQERFEQALAAIAELQELHPYANFSINTPFVLLTSEEFLAYVNRYAVDPDASPIRSSSSGSTTSNSTEDAGLFTTDAEGSSSSSSSQDGGIKTSSAASGETVDWQDAGCVTAVKDQGECGACWAFSATAAMESGYCVASGGSLPSLSDQELISCDDDGESSGCGGGYASYTMEWIADSRGGKMCSLDSYPFASDDGSVPSCAMSSCTEIDIGVSGYDSVREDAGALEDAVRTQPVSVFLYSGSSAFQYYSSGVLTGANCDKTGSHSGLAVGFGETDDDVLYWRIKNQWGTSWGEDGYVRIERRYSGDSEGACGVELYGSWPTFDSVTTTTPSTTTATPTTTPSTTTATPSATTATATTTPSTTTATATTTPSTTTATATTTPSTTTATATTTPSTTTAAQTTETPAATAAEVQNEAQDEGDASASTTPSATAASTSEPSGGDCAM
ncbi:hypothetical protein BBJ28_00009850 [Nothophytophthora sp. Chile5]|nr:hypothetical protein BBJ28_00009850 [Nothophytophthora sp. Chile5]